VASSWFLFFSYHNDARSNTHQIYCIDCRQGRGIYWADDRLQASLEAFSLVELLQSIKNEGRA